MGRVTVEGIGELSFDASAVGVAWTSLTAGREVEVEVGPSRLGGQKIIKLWITGEKLPNLK